MTQSPGISELRGLLEKASLTPLPWKHGNPTGWIWCASAKGGDRHVADIRGWGYFTGGGHGALGLSGDEALAHQKAVGDLIVEGLNSLPTLLDDLAGAQGDIERLREALGEFLNAGGVQWMSGMTTSSAWSLSKLAAASVKAHSALTLKSEKEMGLSRDLRPQPVASEPKNSDVQQVKRCSMCFGNLKPEEDGGRECESCGAVWVEGT
jgi:hypothetical protein